MILNDRKGLNPADNSFFTASPFLLEFGRLALLFNVKFEDQRVDNRTKMIFTNTLRHEWMLLILLVRLDGYIVLR